MSLKIKLLSSKLNNTLPWQILPIGKPNLCRWIMASIKLAASSNLDSFVVSIWSTVIPSTNLLTRNNDLDFVEIPNLSMLGKYDKF